MQPPTLGAAPLTGKTPLPASPVLAPLLAGPAALADEGTTVPVHVDGRPGRAWGWSLDGAPTPDRRGNLLLVEFHGLPGRESDAETRVRHAAIRALGFAQRPFVVEMLRCTAQGRLLASGLADAQRAPAET